jgi:hypothetical protein
MIHWAMGNAGMHGAGRPLGQVQGPGASMQREWGNVNAASRGGDDAASRGGEQ